MITKINLNDVEQTKTALKPSATQKSSMDAVQQLMENKSDGNFNDQSEDLASTKR